MLRYVALHRIMFCYAILCYAILYCAVLCYVMFCYAISHPIGVDVAVAPVSSDLDVRMSVSH